MEGGRDDWCEKQFGVMGQVFFVFQKRLEDTATREGVVDIFRVAGRVAVVPGMF